MVKVLSIQLKDTAKVFLNTIYNLAYNPWHRIQTTGRGDVVTNAGYRNGVGFGSMLPATRLMN